MISSIELKWAVPSVNMKSDDVAPTALKISRLINQALLRGEKLKEDDIKGLLRNNDFDFGTWRYDADVRTMDYILRYPIIDTTGGNHDNDA